MTAPMESRTIAVFYIIDKMTDGKVTSTLTVTVEELSNDHPDYHEGQGRFIVRDVRSYVDERFTIAVDAMRHALNLVGWWDSEPKQI